MNLNLGLIYRKNLDGSYQLINHRSLLKVLINPILRQFGFYINSIYDKENDIIKGLEIRKLKKPVNIFTGYKNSLLYPLTNNIKIVKKRILF